jgi:ureidoglycolate hydrolase
MRTIKASKLTPAGFRPYGYVVSTAKGKAFLDNNEVTCWSKVSLLKVGKTASTTLLFCHKRQPIVRKLERHVRSPEVLVGLDGDSVICVAKPSSGRGAIRGIRAFYLRQGDAIAMHAGTWHYAPFPVKAKQSKLLVLFASTTEASDLKFRDLPQEVRIAGL